MFNSKKFSRNLKLSLTCQNFSKSYNIIRKALNDPTIDYLLPNFETDSIETTWNRFPEITELGLIFSVAVQSEVEPACGRDFILSIF